MFKYDFKEYDFINISFLLLTPIIAIISTYYWLSIDGFNLPVVLTGVILYILSGLSITAGYHRLIAHKAYDSSPIIKFFFLIFGASAFQNSALKWCSDHRVHHKFVDTETDPYNINEGFFHAHMGWIFLKKNNEIKTRFAKDLMKDNLIMWQHKYYLVLAIFIGFILPVLICGVFFDSYLGGVAISFIRVVSIHHCTFFINSLCHYIGSMPYTDTNTAKDSWFMALFTFGEGYHNFHHYFQADYRNGIRWFHFDPTKWLIKSLNLIGLTYKLKITSYDKILNAKMTMHLKNINSKAENYRDELEALRKNITETIIKIEEFKNELKIKKNELSNAMRIEINKQIEDKKSEFKILWQTWQLQLQNIDSLSYS